MNDALMVHCPTCRAPVAWTADNPHRPFCSETCKLIDLGAWADDKRAIPCAEDETLEDWE